MNPLAFIFDAACSALLHFVAWLFGIRVVEKRRKTDATWFHAGTREISKFGKTRKHHWRAGYVSAFRRAGVLISAGIGSYAVILHPVITGLVILVLVATVITAYTVAVIHRRKYEDEEARHSSLISKLRETKGLDNLKAQNLVASGDTVSLNLPEEFDASPTRQLNLTAVLERHYGYDFDSVWTLAERNPRVVWARRPEPPTEFEWEDAKKIIPALTEPQILVGIDGRKDPVIVDLFDSPHFALSAGTGAGKSTVLAGILLQLLMKETVEHISVLDIKQTSLNAFLGLTRVSISKTPQDIHNSIMSTLALMDERETQDKDLVSSTSAWPRHVLVVDEANTMMDEVKAWWAETRQREDPKECPSIKAIRTILLRGRSSNITVVYVGQHLSVAATSGGAGPTGGAAARSQYGVVLMSQIKSEIWTSITGLGRETLPTVGPKGNWLRWNDGQFDIYRAINIDMLVAQAEAQALSDPEPKPKKPRAKKPVVSYTLKEASKDLGQGIVDVSYSMLLKKRSAASEPWKDSGKVGKAHVYTENDLKTNLGG